VDFHVSAIFVNLSLLFLSPAAAGATRPDEQVVVLQSKPDSGRLEMDSQGTIFFRAARRGNIVAAEDILKITQTSPPTIAPGTSPAHRISLWGSEQLSGTVLSIDDAAALVRGPAGDRLRVPLYLVSKIEHAHGDVVVLRDDFEEELPARRTGGEGRRARDRAASGDWAFRLEKAGDSLRYQLAEPVGAGWFEAWFFDTAREQPGQEWSCELEFNSPAGVRTVQVLLGGGIESYGLLAPQGPTLPVQRLARRAGWNRLALRFSAGRTTLLIGDAVLSHGEVGLGMLRAIRFVVRPEDNDDAAAVPAGTAAGFIDDMQFAAAGAATVDRQPTPDQDDVLLDNGDQIFGQFRGATGRDVTMHGEFGECAVPWRQLQEINLTTRPCTTKAVAGRHVRVRFAVTGATARRESHDLLEGVVRELNDEFIAIEHPHIGRIRIVRGQLREMEFFAAGRFIAIDPRFHHFGAKVVARLQAPFPGGTDRRWEFTLDRVPREAAIVLNTVGMEAMAPGGEFTKRLENDEWRTYAEINGQKIDPLGLNHRLPLDAKGSVRLVVPIEPSLLRAGPNTLRLVQTPEKNDASSFDDCGVFGIGIQLSDD